ncbi:MAG: acetyltransferase [Alphaproteobacteria bacterium]|nr:acetyltransferase [Alphaproteobacteria bacterium]
MHESSSAIIIGSGGYAKVVTDALQKQGYQINHVFDDNIEKIGTLSNCGVKIEKMPTSSWWKESTKPTIITIGSNLVRKKIATSLTSARWLTVIHPTAIIHETASIGVGTYIGANVVIQSDAIIGDHSIINTGAIIEHDVFIGTYCHIAPGSIVTGGTHVNEGVFLGVGTKIIPNKKIGEWGIIGAGSVVLKDIPPYSKAHGIPCQIVATLEPDLF